MNNASLEERDGRTVFARGIGVVLTTVQKVGPVLGLFTVERPEWGVSEVSQELGVAKSSAHAIISSMVDIGLLRRTVAGRYRLGWRLVALGRAAVVGAEDRKVIGRILRREVIRGGDTMHFAVYDEGAVVYLDKAQGRHSVRVPTQVGVRLPAHISAVGKVLLAFDPSAAESSWMANGMARYTRNTIVNPTRFEEELAIVRDSGVALDQEEAVRDICCAAAPIYDTDGSILGAVGLTTTRTRFSRRRDPLIRSMKGLGEEITQQVRKGMSGRLPLAPTA